LLNLEDHLKSNTIYVLVVHQRSTLVPRISHIRGDY